MNYQVFDEENDDDDQVVVNFMANDLDLILEPSRMSSQAWTHHQKKMKKDQKKMKGEKKRVKMIEDTCFPIVQYIMKEFQDHLMVKWPCEQSSYYMQRQPKVCDLECVFASFSTTSFNHVFLIPFRMYVVREVSQPIL